MPFKEKPKRTKIITNSLIFTFIGIVLLFIISVPLAKNLSKQYKINQEISDLENEIALLEGKNLELKGLMNYLESDQFVEEQARINLNYMKPGESLVVIKNDDKEDGQGESEKINVYSISGFGQEAEKTKESNFRKWLDYFFK